MVTIMKFNINKELFPFQNNFLHLDDGTKIHYIDEGEGPVLLMLHGNPTWSFLYRKMIAALESNFRCIAPDLPGFGLSSTYFPIGIVFNVPRGLICPLE